MTLVRDQLRKSCTMKKIKMKGKKLITPCKKLQFNMQTTLQLDKNELLKEFI